MLRKESFKITGMSCAACSARIEKKLNKTDGIQTAAVNLATNKASVTYDSAKIKLSDIIKAIEGIGYGASKVEQQSRDTEKEQREKELKSLKGVLILSVVLSSPLILAMIFTLFKIIII